MQTRFTIPARLDALGDIAVQVAALRTAHRRIAPLEQRLVLVLEELATNTIRHGHGDEAVCNALIEIGFALQDDCLQVFYEDHARPFDPTRHVPGAMHGDVEDRAVGGLGIHLVMTIMDRVVYERVGGKNRLTMSMSLAR